MTRTQNMKFYSYHINKKYSLKLSFLLPNLKGKKIATKRGKIVSVEVERFKNSMNNKEAN
jgi:hypothetical protein